MDYSTLGVLAIGILVVVLILVALPARRRVAVRDIDAYARMPGMVGRTIEADRPLHLSLGSAGIGGESTVLAVASAELAYYLTREAAIGDDSPIFTLSSTAAIPLAQDALRRAYVARGFAERFQPTATRWFPAGTRSLTFAAALSALIHVEDLGGNVLAGSHGPELGLVMLSATRMKLPTLAVSDQLEGQAVAYAFSDAPLIGEEVFVSAAYLDDAPGATKVAVTLDILRYVLILVLFVGLALSLGG
jgi:hypothetical protein